MRRSSIFKKTDVTRAARAVLAAGLNVARIEINPRDGTITVVPGKPGDASVDDRELATFKLKTQHDQD
jgi:hypothetical protein